MRQRLSGLVRLSARLFALAALAGALHAQTFVPPTLPAGVEQIAIPTAAGYPLGAAAINALLEKGRSLELTGRWADALSCYEEALREYPQDRALQARFDVARLHYSLEQRYDDRSFRESLRTLRPQQALSQYSDLLTKIETHYYTTPPWPEITARGARARSWPR